MKINPRDSPRKEDLISTENPHYPYNFKTLVLLQIADVYFVTQGLGTFGDSDMIHNAEYFYNEHTCPTNFASSFEFIVQGGNFDPHGCFQFVDMVWMTAEYAAMEEDDKIDWLNEVFPQLTCTDK